MACYDMLKYDKPMPDGTVMVPEQTHYYQFKEFGQNLSIYTISDKGMLTLVEDRSKGTDITAHLNYTGELELVGRNGDYIATFVNSKLTGITVKDPNDFS